MLRLYIIGLFILIIAILANSIAIKLSLLTWYDYLSFLTKSSTVEITIRFIDYLWLFLGYPLVLGCSYLIGDKVYKFLF